MQAKKDRVVTATDREMKVWYETRIHYLDSEQYGAEIGFVVDDAFKSIIVPASLLFEYTALKKELLNAGANRDQIDQTTLAPLQSAIPKKEVQLTKLCGWIDDFTFVQPTWSLGKRAASVKANCTLAPRDSRLGSFAEWHKGLGLPCEASSYLSFAIGVSFAAPLLKVIGENEGVTFNFSGKSSVGKSLACRTALSAFVRANKNEVPTYKATETGLDEICLARNDSLIVIDEQGKVEKSEKGREKIRNLAFTVAGGQGKLRSEFATKAMQMNTASWRAMGLTSGEHPLGELSTKRDAGEQVRHVDIPIGARRGIFDRIGSLAKTATTAELAAQIERVIAANYGCALKVYMRRVLKEDLAKLKAECEQIVEAFKKRFVTSLDPWERRFAEKFGIVLAGMLLASRLGVGPWTAEHARRCVRRLYRKALASVVTVEEHAKKLLSDIEIWKTQRKLPRLNDGKRLKGKSKRLLGIQRKHRTHGEIIALDPIKLRGYFGSEEKSKAVLEWFIAKGAAPDCGKKRRLQLYTMGLPGKPRRRWICVYASSR